MKIKVRSQSQGGIRDPFGEIQVMHEKCFKRDGLLLRLYYLKQLLREDYVEVELKQDSEL